MEINSNFYFDKISDPSELHSYDEIFSSDFKSIPTTSGIYSWYFKTIPPQLYYILNKCHKYEDKACFILVKQQFKNKIKNHTAIFQRILYISSRSTFDFHRVYFGTWYGQSYFCKEEN